MIKKRSGTKILITLNEDIDPSRQHHACREALVRGPILRARAS